MQTKINHASSLITEDHLKNLLSKTGGQNYKASQNKFLPRAQHSAFGDFPNDYLPKKGSKVDKLAPLDKNELAVAATKTGKYPSLLSQSNGLRPSIHNRANR